MDDTLTLGMKIPAGCTAVPGCGESAFGFVRINGELRRICPKHSGGWKS